MDVEFVLKAIGYTLAGFMAGAALSMLVM